MQWLAPEILDGSVRIPANWLHLHYYEAMTILFRTENALRVFVYIVLKDHHGDDWNKIDLASDDTGQANIASLARKRISQDESFGYLGHQLNSPLMYLTSGELVRLITAEKHWPLFKPFFKASKQVVTLKLQEIGTIRNALAHFRTVKEDDVAVVKQNAKQVLDGIEKLLAQVTAVAVPVPTNNEDDWYQQLRTVGSEFCKFGFGQTTDADWVRVTLNYDCPTIGRTPDNPVSYVSLRVLNLDTPAILREHPRLAGHLVFVTENVLTQQFDPENTDTRIRKQLRFMFGRKRLNQNAVEIRSAFEDVLKTIEQETELIRQDNLAAGRLVQSVAINGYKRQNVSPSLWNLGTGHLLREIQPTDPPEFWGSISVTPVDLISDSSTFPWMPVSISNDLVPF